MDTKRIVAFVVAIALFGVVIYFIVKSFQQQCPVGQVYDSDLKRCRKQCGPDEGKYYPDEDECLLCDPGYVYTQDNQCAKACPVNKATCAAGKKTSLCYDPNTQDCMPDKSICAHSKYCLKLHDDPKNAKCCKSYEQCDKETGKCVDCPHETCGGICCEEGEECSDEKTCCAKELLYTDFEGKTHCCSSTDALCPKENPKFCCSSGNNIACNEDTGTCGILCGTDEKGKNFYCNPDTEVCDRTTVPNVSNELDKPYCRPKGCVWKDMEHVPTPYKNGHICEEVGGEDLFFCYRDDHKATEAKILIKRDPDTSTEDCSQEACDQRLADTGLTNAHYDRASQTCIGDYQCSSYMPPCDNLHPIDFPFDPETEDYHLCKDPDGRYTGKFCPENTCVDNYCVNFECDLENAQCIPKVGGTFRTREDCENAGCVAFEYPPVFMIKRQDTDQCVDSSNGGHMRIAGSCDPQNTNQVWYYDPVNEHIVRRSTGKCMDDNDGKFFSEVDCTSYPYPNQAYAYDQVTHQIHNTLKDNQCITGNGDLTLETCKDDYRFQKFTLPSSVWPKNKFFIENGIHCADANNDGPILSRLQGCDSTNDNHVWYHDPNTDKVFRYVNQTEKWCLDDGGAEKDQDKHFISYPCQEGNKNQDYYYDPRTQHFVNKEKNLCMDSGGVIANTPYRAATCSPNNANQIFRLVGV